MPGQRPILAMSFIASLGITFEVLACTLPKNDSNFLPLLVYIFYILLPLPMIISRRIIDETVIGLDRKTSVSARDYAIFFTAGIMVSTFTLPILLARSPLNKPLVSNYPITISLSVLYHSRIYTELTISLANHSDSSHSVLSCRSWQYVMFCYDGTILPIFQTHGWIMSLASET